MSLITKYEFSEEFHRGDMTHRGPFDFYDRCEEEIRAAIASGLPFDTEWRGCKHEILSSRIKRHKDGSFSCRVSVSDDFDTSGIGREGFVPAPGNTYEELWEQLENAMATAHQEADDDRKSNQVYRGFKILVKCQRKQRKPQGRWDRYPRRKISRSNRRSSWIETYILNIGQWWGPVDDGPPGDYYHQWGFQGDDVIPLNVREKLEEYAQSYRKGSPPRFSYKRWTIEPWEAIDY